MKQTRLADRLTANQIEAKNVEERNLSEMKRDMGDSHISFQRSRRIKNKTSVKLKRSKEKRLASIRREPAEPEELYSEDSLEINELLQQRQEEKIQKHQKIFSNIMRTVLHPNWENQRQSVNLRLSYYSPHRVSPIFIMGKNWESTERKKRRMNMYVVRCCGEIITLLPIQIRSMLLWLRT